MNGKNGLHFKVGDGNDLALKIDFLVRNPNVRHYFISNIPHVKTIDENVQELEYLYKKIIKKEYSNL